MTDAARPAAAQAWRRAGATLELALKVVPNAKADAVTGIITDADGTPRLALRLRAPPVDGKANAAVVAWLAKRLGCPKSKLAITAGATARQKRVSWSDPPADAEARLLALLD